MSDLHREHYKTIEKDIKEGLIHTEIYNVHGQKYMSGIQFVFMNKHKDGNFPRVDQ